MQSIDGSTAIIALALFAATAFSAALIDIRTRRIPNGLCLATAALGLGCAIFLREFDAPFWAFVGHGLIALLVGIALFAMRWIGGGDAKYYAAVACWFPLKLGAALFLSVTIFGLVLLIVWFVWRRVNGLPVRTQGGGGLPYGVAIAAGGVAVMIGYFLPTTVLWQ